MSDNIETQPGPHYAIEAGTIYLVHTHETSTASGNVVLVPRPSSDIRDPLRWTTWRKLYHIFLLFLYSSLLGALTNWEATIYLDLIVGMNTSIDSLNDGQAVMLLLLGVGNVFLVPLSNKFGRRCIYLATLVIVLVSQIIMIFAHDSAEYQVAHVLLGLGAAPFEALVAISIDDIFFVHQKGSALGFYVFGLALGSFIGPICTGYMSTSQGWRWVYKWGAILTAAFILICYFTFEETRFIGPIDQQEAPWTEQNLEADDLEPRRERLELGSEKNDEYKAQRSHRTLMANDHLETDTFRVQFKLLQLYPESWLEINRQFWAPFRVITFPAVIWCGVNYGTCVSWLSVLATTVAEVFAAPTYGFGNNAIGLVFIAPMIGSFFGAFYSGRLSDMFVLYLTKKNHGYREPEFRTWLFIPTAFVLSAGLILYGVGAAHALPWIVPVLGTGFVGFGLSVGGATTIGYILDCYPLLATECVTTIILIRNVIGFGITWGIQPWIQGMGLQNCFILIGVLSFVITIAAGVFIIAGKRFRRFTSAKYARLTEYF